MLATVWPTPKLFGLFGAEYRNDISVTDDSNNFHEVGTVINCFLDLIENKNE